MVQIDFNSIKDLMKEVLSVRFTNLELEYQYCIKILEVAKREKNMYGMTFGKTYLGDYYIATGDIVRSLEYLQKAQILAIENGFDHLLKTIYNLSGICYESLHDEQTALQYYLRAFQVLQKLPDPSSAASILNNIASNFEQFNDYDEAVKYYNKAHEEIKTLSVDDINYDYIALRVFTNFAEVYKGLGQYENMKYYLDLCNSSINEFDIPKKYLIARGYCGYYAKTHNYVSSKLWAEKFLSLLDTDPYDDYYLISEALSSVCSSLINIAEKELSKKALDRFEDLIVSRKIDNLKQLQFLKIKFHENFEDLDVNASVYYDYYKIMSNTEEKIRFSKSNGLKNILYLDGVKNSLLAEQITLENEAHLDETTQVYNRRYLNKLASKVAVDTAVDTIGFIMIDLDYFKEYNDSYGHSNGDKALQTVANLLKKHSTPNIQVARYGGDEFICICTNQSKKTLENYVTGVQKDLIAANVEHKTSIHKRLSLSIGISNKKKSDVNDILDIIDFSDKALYDSKNKGRNTYSFYND